MWRIAGVLGHGGHGTVYLAERTDKDGLSRKVALKVLGPAGAAAAQRLRDEARILALVRHRAVARADALVRVEGRWAVQLEFVEGASLRDALCEGPLPPPAALEVAAEIARALDAVWHAPGADGTPLHVVHRDLKPSNVQLTAAGEVKLLDFGIARAAAAWRESVTTEGVAGTVGYVPPERLEGGPDGPAGDVFALGVLVAEMLTGSPVRQFPVGPERHARHLGEVLARLPLGRDLLTDLLALDPARRPTAREAERRIEALRLEVLGGGNPGATLRDWAEANVPRLHVAPATDDPLVGREIDFEQPSQSVGAAPPPSRARTPLRVVAVVLVLAAAILVLSEWLPGSPGDESTAAQPAPPAVLAAPSADEAEPMPVVDAPAPRAPTAAARPAMGSVRVTGDAERVVFVDAAGIEHAAGTGLTPGEYRVRVRFPGLGDGPGGTVRVEADREALVSCSSAALTCRVE